MDCYINARLDGWAFCRYNKFIAFPQRELWQYCPSSFNSYSTVRSIRCQIVLFFCNSGLKLTEKILFCITILAMTFDISHWKLLIFCIASVLINNNQLLQLQIPVGDIKCVCNSLISCHYDLPVSKLFWHPVSENKLVSP